MKPSSPASLMRVSASNNELFARLRSPDVASQIKSRLREVRLRPTRTRVALGSILFGKGDRHVPAEMLFMRKHATLTSQCHSRPSITPCTSLPRSVFLPTSRQSTPRSVILIPTIRRHHHYYVEGRHELIDIPPTNVVLGKTPEPPEGYEIVRIDVVVRLRRMTVNSAPTS